MTISWWRRFGCVCVSGAMSMAVGATAAHAQSAQATASASATVQAAGRVGTSATVAPVVTPSTRQTSTTIRTIPISATSNIGFGDVAAAAAASDVNAAATQRGNAGGTTGSLLRPFRDQRMVPMQIGQGSAVAVAGAPNQTYAVILPQRTVYANSGTIVSMAGFQHNAGATPSLNAGGADTFSIGATVEIQQMIEAALSQSASTGAPTEGTIIGGTDGGTSPATAIDRKRRILLQAFAPRSPFVNIVVSYN